MSSVLRVSWREIFLFHLTPDRFAHGHVRRQVRGIRQDSRAKSAVRHTFRQLCDQGVKLSRAVNARANDMRAFVLLLAVSNRE